MDKNLFEKELFDKIIISLREHEALPEIVSIIVTGSFGRHEETFSIVDNNEILISDVEIAIVYKKIEAKKILLKLLSSIEKEFVEELNFMLISERRIVKKMNFNYSLISNKKKTIFMYDLYNGSYTIFGKELIKDRFITISELDKYEAKRLVANRIGELIYLSDNNKLSKQWKAKLILSIGSAWLILNNKYYSSYSIQYENVLYNKSIICGIFGNLFLNDYIKSFNYLRENGEEYDVNIVELKKYVACIIECLKNDHIYSSKVNSLSRYTKYCYKLLKTLNFKYNVFKFEEEILDNLLNEFVSNNKKLDETAKDWYNILY